MLHVCVQKFDMMENLENFCKILGTKQAPGFSHGAGTVAAESGASFSVLGPSLHRNSRACFALVQHFRALRCVHTCVPGVSITEPPILVGSSLN